MDLSLWLPLIHLAATASMTGIIWFVQVVHYPLFAAVGPEHFAAYERWNTARTTWVVAPLMLLELGAALALLFAPPRGIPFSVTLTGFLLLAGIWISTALLQVPEHAILEGGYDAAAQSRLVLTNWIRTTLWTLRTLLALFVAAGVLGRP